jgi:putative salt-induced outer membrane protein YdiY
MKYILLLTCIFYISIATAQILDAESLRKVTDTTGWSGTLSANFALKRNVNDFLVLGSDIHIQYKNEKNLWLFKNDFGFEKIDDNKFENSGITHVRYNYRYRPRVAWEIFVQGQYNKVNLIGFRALAGTGPRFKITNSEKYKFYLGTLIMFEYEDVTDGITPLQRDLRGSSYLSFSLYPSEHVTLVSTTYYQPNLSAFEDYRISNKSSMLVGLFANFSLKVSYSFIFDTFPAVGIRKSQYNFSTGLAYSFD